MPTFGRFESFSKFLDAYEESKQEEAQRAETNFTLAARRTRRRQQRDVVEVSALVHVHEPDDVDGDRHLRLRVHLTEVLVSDPDVDQDVQRCLTDQEDVFVAIRIGDRMGILDPPTTGLDSGSRLHLRGEWIPVARAQAHGGERMSVLHFTHHPLGFICTELPQERCYS